MEVGFADTTIPEAACAELEDVLRGIAVEPPGYAGDPVGRWVEPVERITVLRRLAGGRSGADVLDVELERAAPGRVDRRIVKVDAVAEVATEWRAFRDHLASRRDTLITPVEAVSRRLLDEDPSPTADRAAIVYYHAADYGSVPDRPTRTLEDLVRDVLRGRTPADDAVAVVDALLSRMTKGFYADAAPASSKRTLLPLNRSLGPDITLEVDRAPGPRLLKYQDPVPAALAGMRRYQREVLAACTAVTDAGPADRKIGIGDTVHLTGLTTRELSDDALKADWGDLTVVIRPAADTDPGFRLADFAGARDFDVIGRVTGLRARDQWQRVERRWPGVVADDSGVGTDEARVEHPFRLVHDLLTEDAAGRVTALTHGDLNPRNVLWVGGQVFLIDFAATAPGRPLLGDFAWLELCLLRDVVAPELGWRALVLLQRTLAVACRLDEVVADAARAVAGLLGDDDEALRSAFAVLWAVRARARASYPEAGRQPWWRDYLTQLALAGCRTLKWPDDSQGEAAVRAVVACCGVAAEWLGGTDPYRRWPGADTTLLIDSVTRNLRADHAGAVEALAELVRAADRLRGQPEATWRALEAARAAVTAATYAAEARKILVELRDDHEVFIGLRASKPEAARVDDLPAEWVADLEHHAREVDGAVSGRRGPAVLPIPSPHYGSGRHGDARTPPDDEGEVLRWAAEQHRVVVLGSAGSGKSTVARELRYRLAHAVNEAGNGRTPEEGAPRPLMPVLVRGSDVVRAIDALGADASPGEVLRRATGSDVPDAALVVGAVHLAVDAFNELAAEPKRTAAQWVWSLVNRFRHTPVLICHRTFEFEARLLPYPTVVLLPVSTGQAREYVADALRVSGVDDAAERARQLTRMLLDNPDHEQVQDLAKTPLFLWMIVKRYAGTAELPSNIGALFGDFARWYLEERHHDRPGERVPTPRFAYEVKGAAMEALGRYLVEHGNVTQVDEAEAVAAVSEVVHDAAAVLDEIVASEMLHRHDGSLRFLHQSFQEYFAALVFAREADDEQLLRDRAKVFAWREPLRIMLGFSGDRPELTERLIRIALRADPGFAAKLLRASETPPRSAVDVFIAAQRDALASPDLSEHDWTTAARALADHGAPEAIDVLRSTAIGGSPPGVRIAAFEALLHRAEGDDGGDLVTTVGALLAEDTPPPLRAAAVHAVGDKRLVPLTLAVGDLVDDRQPWPIVTAAVGALTALGVVVDGERRRRYARACAGRLRAVEDQLRRHHLAGEDVDALMAERLDLLSPLADPPEVELLLSHRFSYGLAGERVWQRRLAPSAVVADPGLSPAVRHLLVDDVEAEELLAAFTDPGSGEPVVAAAAHRLIGGVAPAGAAAANLVPLVTAGSSTTRLLATAAAVEAAGERLGADDLRAVDALVRDVIDRYEDDLAEPLAALIRSLGSHRLNQIVLADVMDVALGALGTRAHPLRWPLPDVWSSIHPTAEEFVTLLQGDQEHVWVAIRHLAGYGYSLDGSRKSRTFPVRSDAATFRRLLAERPARLAEEPVSFFEACAVLGDHGFVDDVIVLTRNPDPALTEPRLFFGVSSGAVMITPLARLLGVLGHLGRQAADKGDSATAHRAHDHLDRYDVTGAHISVAQARLVGLGYLGDWMPLLSALDAENPELHTAARNTIALWVPGPFTPTAYQGPEQIALWIADRLNGPLGPGHRSTLLTIKTDLEARLGRYVVQDDPEG
ncbi:hypothetical protein [Saccharothrix xinjiangensis]|uniref:Ternary complex associated domain-containing protein n=1 Tax=Saccharothrix xinjiangensis TaxID=204798 RepID=A0ABV9Y989_9PSEU